MYTDFLDDIRESGNRFPPPQLSRRGITYEPPARQLVGAPSLYGGLLGGSESTSAKVEDFVGHWVVRGAWGEILYAVALFCLAFSTWLHMDAGLSFGFGVDMFEALAMCGCKAGECL